MYEIGHNSQITPPTAEQDERLIKFLVKIKPESRSNVVFTYCEVFGGKSLIDAYYADPEATLNILEESLDFSGGS